MNIVDYYMAESVFAMCYKTPVNLEDLDVDFGLRHFKLFLFLNEGDEETNS